MDRVPSDYDPHQALAGAIVRQATVDLKGLYWKRYKVEKRIQAAQQRLERGQAEDSFNEVRYANGEISRARMTLTKLAKAVRETEAFFYSDWFIALSDLDGPALQEQVFREHEARVLRYESSGQEPEDLEGTEDTEDTEDAEDADSTEADDEAAD